MRAVTLCAEIEALWGPPADDGPVVEPHQLSHLARPDEQALRLAWAAFCSPTRDLVPLRRLLAETDALARIRTALVWPEQTERQLKAAPIWRLTPDRLTTAAIQRDLDRSIAMARAGLLADPALHEAWEVQRWGAWCAEARTARFFPVGLCLLALARTGGVAEERVRGLMASERCEDGYRYYGKWRGIPPDADDAGLALQLLPFCPDQRDALQHTVDLLRQNRHGDGWLPTWLEQGLREPTLPDAPTWLVRRCAAVNARALLGLLDAEWPLPEGWIQHSVNRLAQVLETEGAIDAYPRDYGELLVARLGTRVSGLEDFCVALGRRVLATREKDGGWGSPHATACRLMTADILGLDMDPRPAALYLCTRQEPDGLWPREALYHCPGRDHRQHDYATRSVTSALCLEALSSASTALSASAG